MNTHRLTRAQARLIDRLAAERYGIPSIVLMENAARGAADIAGQMLGGVYNGPVGILCGGGNNGGDGLAVARHLHNRGADVTIWLPVDPERYQGDARTNYQIARAMDLRIQPADPVAIGAAKPRLWVDAIFGTGLSEAPREPFGKIVRAVAGSMGPVLAIDLPSGLDCDTGEPFGECMRAARTVTFVAEKIGFAVASARAFLGVVSIADIGCPIELLEIVRGMDK